MFVVLAVFAPWIAPQDPIATSWSDIRKAPSAAHWFGTDEIGRDVLSRVIWGTRASLLAGVVSVSISLMLGVPIGLAAGFIGGFVDGLISRITDAFLACPFLILAIALAAFLGPSLTNAMIAIGVSATPVFVRLTRAQVLNVKVEDYIEAARAVGNPPWRVAWRHVMPNVLAPLIVQATLAVAAAVIAEASLSFLGSRPATAGAELGQHAEHREGLRRQRPVDGDLAGRCRSSCSCCRSTWSATACATHSIRGSAEALRFWRAPSSHCEGLPDSGYHRAGQHGTQGAACRDHDDRGRRDCEPRARGRGRRCRNDDRDQYRRCHVLQEGFDARGDLDVGHDPNAGDASHRCHERQEQNRDDRRGLIHHVAMPPQRLQPARRR